MRKHRITIGSLLAGLLALPLTASVEAPPAEATPPRPESVAERQAPLDGAADAVTAAVSRRPVWTAHYGGTELSVPDRTVTFYWKGDLGSNWAPASDFVRLAFSFRTARVKIRVLPSRFAVRELKMAAERLSSTDATVSAVAVEGDSSGLIAETSSRSRADAGNRRLRTARLAASRKLALRI